LKKKTSKKELEAKIIGLEQKIDSYNVLFGMYVGFKGDDKDFQAYLKAELDKKDD
jgi:hypothetical protein